MEEKKNEMPVGLKFVLVYFIAIIAWFILFVLGSLILAEIFEFATVAQVFWGIISFVGVAFGTGFATVAISEGDW